jgi:hypothetical protein
MNRVLLTSAIADARETRLRCRAILPRRTAFATRRPQLALFVLNLIFAMK